MAAWTNIRIVQWWYRRDCVDILTIRETVVDPAQAGQESSSAPLADV